MNVLVTTPNSSAVLDIIDCTEHMEVGGKKDAKYIASIFEEHIAELDPYGIHLNAVLFDGASNVQKAGRVIEAKYPQVSVLHGIEHVISLFFSNVSRLPFLHFAIINYRRVYRVFGSGSMHSPYAIFRKQAQTFNGGFKIGLLRAADTRMAGYFYALHRMLRLKPALEATVASAEFIGLNLSKPVVTKAVNFINDKEMWNALYCVLRCLFPALRVLRLADKSEPGFDCLYYFIRRTDLALDWSSRSFELKDYFTKNTRSIEVVMDRMENYKNENEHLEDDDGDEFMDMIETGQDGEGRTTTLSLVTCHWVRVLVGTWEFKSCTFGTSAGGRWCRTFASLVGCFLLWRRSCVMQKRVVLQSLTLLWIDCWENCITVSQIMSWMQ